MIAVTLLSSYLYCARRVFLEKVLGIRVEIPREALVKGSIRHEVYEKINLAEEEIVRSVTEPDAGSIYNAFKNRYMKILKRTIAKNKDGLKSVEIPLADFFASIKPSIENEAEYRALRISSFAAETGFTGEELWLNLTPKIKPEYRISSKVLGIRGIIDELEVHPGFFVPRELKTGRAPSEGVWPGHKIQAGAYALMLESEFKVPVKTAVVKYLDTNSEREVVVNAFLKQEIKELINTVSNLLNSRQIPDFCGNEKKCKACDLKDVCFASDELEKMLKNKTKDLNRT